MKFTGQQLGERAFAATVEGAELWDGYVRDQATQFPVDLSLVGTNGSLRLAILRRDIPYRIRIVVTGHGMVRIEKLSVNQEHKKQFLIKLKDGTLEWRETAPVKAYGEWYAELPTGLTEPVEVVELLELPRPEY